MMVMEDMLKDFLLGEHLLLVGNQVSETSLKVHGTSSLINNEIKYIFCFIEIAFICTTELFGQFFDSLSSSVHGFYGHMCEKSKCLKCFFYNAIRVKRQNINSYM